MKKTIEIFTFLFFMAFPALSFAYGVPTTVEHLRKTELSVRALPSSLEGIPRGAIRVKILPLKLRASCSGGVKVKSIRVKNVGLGDSSDIKGVYVMNNDRRITRSATFSSGDQSVIFRMKNARIPACKSVQLDVTVDFRHGTTVGSRFAVKIESADDIIATAGEISGDFPMRSREPAPKVTPEPVGTAVVEFLPTGGTIVAVRNELLAKFTIKAQGNTHQIIHSIALTNKGSAKGNDLRNMYLTHSRGRALTPVVEKLDKDKAVFKFSRPFFLRKGKKMLFRMRGRAYSTSKTVEFGLEEPPDLFVVPTRRADRKVDMRKRRGRVLR